MACVTAVRYSQRQPGSIIALACRREPAAHSDSSSMELRIIAAKPLLVKRHEPLQFLKPVEDGVDQHASPSDTLDHNEPLAIP